MKWNLIAGHCTSMEMLKKSASDFVRDRAFLAKLVEEVSDRYDYILIDCPPNLYLMTHNALVASDRYIVTAIPDHLSTIGLNILKRKVDKIAELMRNAATGVVPVWRL